MKTLTHIAFKVLTFLILGLLVSCGTNLASPVPGPSSELQPTFPSASANATSFLCDNTQGIEALYWDFSNGLARGDYPLTSHMIPTPVGGHYQHPNHPLFNFTFPSRWQPFTLSDALGRTMGANLVRQDQRAVWRWVQTQIPYAVSARWVLNAELNQMLGILGIRQPVEIVCFRDINQGAVAALIRAGEYTANINVQITRIPLAGGMEFVSLGIQLVAAPTAEYNAVTNNVFFPVTGQLKVAGGTTNPECSDGEDNDGDGKRDFGNDPDCTSPEDDNENF